MNNALIGLGILGILGTGTAAVAVNTQSLMATPDSALTEASQVLLPETTYPEVYEAPSVPVESAPIPGDTVTPSVESPAPSSPQVPAVSPVQPAPAPVDGTSSGSAYYEDDDDDHDDDDGHDHDDDDDHDHDDDDD